MNAASFFLAQIEFQIRLAANLYVRRLSVGVGVGVGVGIDVGGVYISVNFCLYGCICIPSVCFVFLYVYFCCDCKKKNILHIRSQKKKSD